MSGNGSIDAGSIDTRSIDRRVGGRIIRFDRAERWLHWINATLVIVVMSTGAILYFGPLEGAIGRRLLIKTIHVYCGVALPIPVIAVLVGRWRRGFVRDVERISRWTHDDTIWLRSRGRSAKAKLGKFNAGQKLNAVFIAGVLPVMLLTGAIMRWFWPFSDSWRTGATFVHDCGAFGVWITVTLHILKALNEPEALRAMWSGWVPEKWASKHRPRWYAEVVAGEAEPGTAPEVQSIGAEHP